MFFRNPKLIAANLFMLLLFSCSSKKDNEVLVKEINNGLVQSNLILNGDNRNTIELFKNKLADPITKVKAESYYPKLLHVQQTSEELKIYIDALKLQIEKAFQAEPNINPVTELLISNGKYKELYKRLKQYREKVLLADSMQLGQVREYFIVISREQDTVDNDNFLKQCLKGASPIEAITYLNKLQNNITLSERICIIHYNESVRDHIDWFRSYNSIVAQSAKVLKVGDELEISGGVGAFSKDRLLEFSVNGQQVKPNDKGIANYKFKTLQKPGAYSVPVFIRMLDEDSVEQKLHFIVEYNLVETLKKN